MEYPPAVPLRGAVLRAVVIGKIEMGDAVVEGGEADVPHILKTGDIAEIVPEAQGDARQLQAAFAAFVILHFVISCV